MHAYLSTRGIGIEGTAGLTGGEVVEMATLLNVALFMLRTYRDGSLPSPFPAGDVKAMIGDAERLRERFRGETLRRGMRGQEKHPAEG